LPLRNANKSYSNKKKANHYSCENARELNRAKNSLNYSNLIQKLDGITEKEKHVLMNANDIIRTVNPKEQIQRKLKDQAKYIMEDREIRANQILESRIEKLRA